MSMNNSKAFSEVIESSLQSWLSQCWQWNQFPAFGSLLCIKTKKRTLFGIVHQIKTGSMDPVRYPFAYKKTHEELMQEQPQIFEFLKTTYSCLSIGYQEKSKIYYLVAPEPPAIHSFVEPIEKDLARQFFANQNFLPLLFGLSGQIFNLDELLLALLKQQQSLGILSEDKIKDFIDAFSLMSANDYRRTKLFVQRIQQLL